MRRISDLSHCTPEVALSDDAKRGCWRRIPYETDDFAGVMIGAAPTTAAPEVTLPLDAEGWHALHVGFWNPHHDYQGNFRVKLKLTGDPCFQPIADPEPPLIWPGTCELKEVLFRQADLTGKALIIAQQIKGTRPEKAYIAYVRLVPLSPEEVSALVADRADRSTRMLYALNDGNGMFYEGASTESELIEQVEPYRHSDVGAVLFAVASGDLVNYPSRFGLPWMADAGDDTSTPDRCVLRDCTKGLLDQGIVPVQILSEHCQAMDIAFHAMFRMGIVGEIPPGDLWNPRHGFVRKHPEWRMCDRDGTPFEKASYAYPEVRDFMIGMIEEVSSTYDVNGVNLGFIRGPHFVGYETPVVEAFQRAHGIDPRELDENDERAQRHRAAYVTELVRETRRRLDAVGAARGHRIELSAMVYRGNTPINLFYGLDVETWFREKLLDTIFMSLPVEEKILAAARDAGCRVVTHLMPSSRDARADEEETLAMALQGFDTGVDGFWYWDMNARQIKPEYWEVLRRIGHQDEVHRMASARPRMPRTRLRTVGGFDVWHTTNHGADDRDYWPPEMQPIFSGG